MFARVACVTVVALCLAGCNHRTPPSQPTASPQVRVAVATAKEGTLNPRISLPGIVAPFENVALTSSLNEPAKTVDVHEGDHVKAGQVLAILDTADLRANLAADRRTAAEDEAKVEQAQYQATQTASQSTSGVQNAQATVTQDERKLSLDRLTLQRDEQLLSKGFIATQTVDQQRALVAEDKAAVSGARAALRNAETTAETSGSATGGLNEANVRAARAAAASSRAQAQQVQTQIDKATIRSPISGIVVNRNINPGEYPGTRQIFTIQKLNPVYVNLSASSSQVFRIKPGDAVSVGGTNLGGKAYAGKVEAVLGELSPGSTNFTVKTKVANPEDRLQSGMVVTGSIALSPVHGIVIPSSAFLTTSDDSVMVDQNGTAVARAVHAIAVVGSEAAIAGIPAGTAVVRDGQRGLADGERVAIR